MVSPANVLLVEDDEIDIKLIKRAFEGLRFNVDLHVVNNGSEALRFLHRSKELATAAKVDLVLLDINMPRMSGKELLAEVRRSPDLRRTVILILTSSEDERDVNSCYELGANGYICKPITPCDIKDSLEKTLGFWLNVATLPTR